MNAWAFRTVAAVALGVLLWFFPLVRVVPLSALAADAPAEEFDPAVAARDFWNQQLLPATADANPAAEVAAALASDPEQAKQDYGQSLGVGRSFFLFVRGEGEVTAATPRAVTVRLGEDENATVSLSRGPLFDTALRDAPGLLDIDSFASTRDFNLLSAELNKLCEAEEVPLLADLKPGDRVRFAGCGRVASAARFKPPLVLSPVKVEAAP